MNEEMGKGGKAVPADDLGAAPFPRMEKGELRCIYRIREIEDVFRGMKKEEWK
jgi:hypothetical protein